MGNTIVGSGTSSGPVISVENARAHVSDEEYTRIYTSFSRFKKPYLTLEDFCFHVLGGVDLTATQQLSLFHFFSRGTDTLSFENLFCSLVGLCRVEEVQSKFIEEHHEFSSWGLRPPLLTVPMNDAYISFYEVMSYVTHLSVSEVMELEKVFATISDRAVCKMSLARWNDCLADCFPKSFSDRLFRVFDENGDGHIDFRELVCGLSAMCRGPFPSRLSFLAKLWDDDGDNFLDDNELTRLFDDLCVKDSDRTLLKSGGDKAAVVDFTTWAMENDYAKEYYAMAMEVGHICLGLRPEAVKLEHAVVGSFESRTRSLLLPTRNIVSAAWHREWEAQTVQGNQPPPVDNSNIKGSKDDDGWSGKVACISSESASLRLDLARTDYVAVPPPLWRAWLRWHRSAFTVDGQFTRRYLPGEFFEDGKGALELYPLDILLMGHDRRKTRDSEGTPQMSPWACAQVSRCMTIEQLLQLCISELRLKKGEARLWLLREKEVADSTDTLLDDDERTLHQLGLNKKKVNKLLLEVRDQGTGVWPQELRASQTGTQITSITSSIYSGRPGAVGLVNSGNYCYRNAAVQCLSRVSPLTHYLMSDVNIELIKKSQSPNKYVDATIEYANLLKEMWEGAKKNITPTSFSNAIRNTSDIFDDGEQHDCQEFVAHLIEILHTTLHNVDSVAVGSDDPTDVSHDTSNDEVANEEWKKYLKRERSLVTNLFSGQLCSRLFCRACKSSSTVFEPFTSLSLPIGFDNVELYQIIVARRNGTVPRRFGFRLQRDSTLGKFKELISDAAGLEPNSVTLQCLSSRGTILEYRYEDTMPLHTLPSGARLYALELPDVEKWRLAAHRKLQYNYEPYLLGSTEGCIVSRFGLPLIVPYSDQLKGKELYDDVMQQMRRFMEIAPAAFSNRAMDPCEDSSSGYPFSLSIVNATWEWCGQCPPMRFCRGCVIRPDDSTCHMPDKSAIAIDWLPIALYLKYNYSEEMACVDDPSVAETWTRHLAPSSLEECLAKFSCAETLEEQLFCEKCSRKTSKDKVMSIWKLPKYLIIHLKRFEYLRNERRMGKCKRKIDFPLTDFDASPFVDTHDGGKYDCIAIANHYGQLSSGHFATYARGSDNKWLLLNDCSVKEVVEEDIDKSAAYLIFYERVSE